MMLTSYQATPADYPQVLQLWEQSVRATHHFLKAADLQFYKKIIPENLVQVDLRLWQVADELIGFSGTHQTELVMLFLAPAFIGRGYGQQIINQLDCQQRLQTVTVNQQNTVAKRFYDKQGFVPISVAPVDGFGKPYPIMQLHRD